MRRGKKIPKGQLCDGYLPVVYPERGSPWIPKCKELATVCRPNFFGTWTAYFCAKHDHAYSGVDK